MTEAMLLLDQLQDELHKIKNTPFIPWNQANRTQLVEKLHQWHAHTKQAGELLTLLQLEQLKYAQLKEVDVREAETFIKKTGEMLERNIQFEKDKTKRKIDLTEKITTPALGAEIEARMHRQWMALQRVHEQFNIALRKSMNDEHPVKGMEGELFSLIRTKEDEIQKIKQERDVLKREKYFGPNEKYSLTDMENELHELLQQFAIEKHAVFDHLELGKKKIDEYANHHMHLENKTKKLEHLVSELQKKHLNILTMLKKERDYARKLAMDLETETASVRALYSKELLTLEDKKHAIKKEIEEKHAQKIFQLEKKVKEQESLLKELDALAREKERQIQRMAEKMPFEKNKETIKTKRPSGVQ
ncbi:MAG: hypothetical protein V1776_05580 [Candidatus Diapherotrites archaeon]